MQVADLLSAFTTCWPRVATPCSQWLAQRLHLAEEVVIEGRRFQILQQLGEGGYSFVYLVHELPSIHCTAELEHYALKKILAASSDQLAEARREISVMSKVDHDNVLPLLASAVVASTREGVPQHTVYMLYPLYEEGSAMDLVTSLAQQQQSLSERAALHIFHQVCQAVQAMHSQPECLIHRDIKPQNVLLRRQQPGGHRPPEEGRDAGSSRQAAAGAASCSYHAVLMDFGSTKAGRMEVSNRTEALLLQEEAERMCTAPYRAPELFDVPSKCTIDERVDVWSLGCLLYFLLYGISPFEGAIGQTGGSLALAVLNGSVSFPAAAARSPQVQVWAQAVELIQACLVIRPEKRPFVGEVLDRIHQLLSRQ